MRRPLRLEQAFWSANSRTWDDVLADGDIAAHVGDLAAWLAENVAPGTVVVDFGCGTGNHAITLQSRGLRAVGIDITPGMLHRAAAKRDARGEPVRLLRADLQRRLPLKDASVGAAISVYSTQFLDPHAFFPEVARILRRGGAFLVEVPQPADDRRPLRDLSFRWRTFDRVKDLAAAVGRRTGLVHWHTPADLHAALGRAGFEIVDERVGARSRTILARA